MADNGWTTDNSWMIAQVAEVPGVRHVVVCSADGLVAIRSQGTDRDVADRLAAACSGLHSLARSVANAHGEKDKTVLQQMVEFAGGFLFVQAAGDGSRLAVLTSAEIDPARIGQQMTLQVRQIGARALSTPARRTAPE